MDKNADIIFEEYADLYKLTNKTADAHIEFYKKKEAIPMEDLITIWKKLSLQADNFDKRLWIENWHNWHKNLHAFERHKFEAKFLIQHYLSDVLEELTSKLLTKYEESLRKSERTEPHEGISEFVKKEVKRQVKQELKKKKKKKRENAKTPSVTRASSAGFMAA